MSKEDANKIRGKLVQINAGHGYERPQQKLSILNGMTPRQHCEKMLKERNDTKGYFKELSVGEDVCYMLSPSYYPDPNPVPKPVWSYYYEIFEKIQLTSETDFTLPTNRKRTTIGVGEGVTVRSNIPVNWQLPAKNMALVDKTTDYEIHFFALDQAGNIKITAIDKKKSDNKQDLNIAVITPTDLRYSQSYTKDAYRKPIIYHPKNKFKFFVGLQVTVQPMTVNFGNLTIQELNVASVDTGVFKIDGKSHCHIGETCKSTGKGLPIKTEQQEYNILGYDIVGAYSGLAETLTVLPDSSSMSLSIPIQWKLTKQNKWHNFPKNVRQVTTLLKDGSMTIVKGNYQKTVKKSDSFENDMMNIETILRNKK